jgi:hypothetical protein
VLLRGREHFHAERGYFRSPRRVRLEREQGRSTLAQTADEVHSDVAAPDQTDRGTLERNVERAQHPGQHVKVALPRRARRIGDHAALEARVEVLQGWSAPIGHHAMSQILSRRETKSGA